MADAAQGSTVKVWDLFVRASHWSLGLLVLGSFLTSEKDRLLPVHARIGLAIAVLVLVRVLWGFVGSRPARFRAFVRGPREVFAYARALAAGRAPLHLTHNPLGGAMVVVVLVVLLACTITGAIVYAGPEFQGPLTGLLGKHAARAVKELHEGSTGLLLGLIGLHVVGVLFSSWREGQNLVVGMITGAKRAPHAPAPTPDRPGRSRQLGPRAAPLVALAVVALGIPAAADAASPAAAELLREYAAQVRRERPTFSGFSADEGRKLYFAEFVQGGEKLSCASCHTASPRNPGRTPAGKVVDPLAPAVNPARLTDRADVEKWFKRNCKQVLGRECSAEEKGHFVTWLLAA